MFSTTDLCVKSWKPSLHFFFQFLKWGPLFFNSHAREKRWFWGLKMGLLFFMTQLPLRMFFGSVIYFCFFHRCWRRPRKTSVPRGTRWLWKISHVKKLWRRWGWGDRFVDLDFFSIFRFFDRSKEEIPKRHFENWRKCKNWWWFSQNFDFKVCVWKVG